MLRQQWFPRHPRLAQNPKSSIRLNFRAAGQRSAGGSFEEDCRPQRGCCFAWLLPPVAPRDPQTGIGIAFPHGLSACGQQIFPGRGEPRQYPARVVYCFRYHRHSSGGIYRASTGVIGAEGHASGRRYSDPSAASEVLLPSTFCSGSKASLTPSAAAVPGINCIKPIAPGGDRAGLEC